MGTRVIAPLLAAVFFLAGWTSCAHREQAASGFSPAEKEMERLIVRRLELSRLVAWHKYQFSLPVSDPEREAQLMESLLAAGVEKGIAPEVVERFFESQIAASRDVQRGLIRSWERGGELPAWPPLSLQGELRPELTEVSAEMVVGLARLENAPVGRTFASAVHHSLREAGFSLWVARKATAGLPR